MRKRTCTITLLLITIFLTSCASVQKNFPQTIEHPPEQLEVSFEEGLLPFIVMQINKTAATFFYYDKDEKDRKKSKDVDNAIRGDNEIGGVCGDYASHFIDNFNGPGNVYLMLVGPDGTTSLEKRVKLFEKNDIKLNDNKAIDSFIEEQYRHYLLNTKQGNTIYYCSDRRTDERFSSFYTRIINGIVYWSENSFNDKTPLIPFKKEHIKLNLHNYQLYRNEEKAKLMDERYNWILQQHRGMNGYKSWQALPSLTDEWSLESMYFQSNMAGKLFLIENTYIQMPNTHAGMPEKELLNHGWVRIIWNGMTVDIDPTWYDNGLPLEQVVEIWK